MKSISREVAAEMIRNSKGRTFTVGFIKQDNTYRSMNARLGVKKYLRGGESSTKDRDDLIDVYDMKIGDKPHGYRKIPVPRIVDLKINGEEFTVGE